MIPSVHWNWCENRHWRLTSYVAFTFADLSAFWQSPKKLTLTRPFLTDMQSTTCHPQLSLSCMPPYQLHNFLSTNTYNPNFILLELSLLWSWSTSWHVWYCTRFDFCLLIVTRVWMLDAVLRNGGFNRRKEPRRERLCVVSSSGSIIAHKYHICCRAWAQTLPSVNAHVFLAVCHI